MLVKEVFEIVNLINTNFTEIKRFITKTKAYARSTILASQLESIDKDLNNINGELSELASNADEKFLNKYVAGSYRKQGALIQPELGLANISNYLHSLDVNFEDLLRAVQSYAYINDQDLILIQTVYKDINKLILAFNATEVRFSNSKEEKLIENSEISKEIIAESMKIIGKELDSQLIDNKQKTEKMVQRFQSKINEVEISTENNLEALRIKANVIEELYETTLAELEEKKEQMDEVLGHTANRVMAQDYDLSAVAEKKAANWLRGGSIACMAIIVSIVFYSFYDSTHSEFAWESSIFRTVLVFILSIPAAYLSRESTKHREQQYNYHHTALDLKAITPYIASLPEADQNRIKISIAERIFASRQTNANQQDSFPLNTQELMMELIKKVDLSRKSEQQDKAEKGS
ncbi:hypothetical protein ACU8V4_03720 [Pseudoalteromonas mariniglutinosa]